MTAQEFKNEVLKTDYSNLEVTLPPKSFEKWSQLIKEVPLSEPNNTLIYNPIETTAVASPITSISSGSVWKTYNNDTTKVSIYNSDSFDKDYEEWEKDNIETIKFLEFSSVDVKSAREIAEYFYKKALSYGRLV
jgi:hypothetical protein